MQNNDINRTREIVMYEQETAEEEAQVTLRSMDALEAQVHEAIKRMVDEFREWHGIEAEADDGCLCVAASMATHEALFDALNPVREMVAGLVGVNEREYDKHD